MRLGNSRREADFEINVIPLIDVLLTLLMFFVLTTTFIRHGGMKVTLPTAHAKAATAQTHPLVVMIDRNGHFYVGGHQVLGQDENALRRAIVAVAGDDRARAVTLQADARTTHQSVVTAMDVLGRLGFNRLSMATTQPHASAAGR
ncbi:MAG TPA: biopolymer transporter ExbD [Oleiagrimonas sp.]|nr:biopolymer transporter ExbD [Oleiagrimonas sp.]